MPWFRPSLLGLIAQGCLLATTAAWAAPAPADGMLFKFERRGTQCAWLRISPTDGKETTLALLEGKPATASWFPHRTLPRALVWTDKGLWEIDLDTQQKRALELPLEEKVHSARYDEKNRPFVLTQRYCPMVFEQGRWREQPHPPLPNLNIWPRANDLTETADVSDEALRQQLRAIRAETKTQEKTVTWVQLTSRHAGPIYIRSVHTDDETADATILPLVLSQGGKLEEVQDLHLKEDAMVGLTFQGEFVLLNTRTASRLIHTQTGALLYSSDKGEPAQFWPIWRGLGS